MFGLFLIAVANVIAALGYIIMPDKTPDANDGSLYIKKKTPVFSVQMLKERKNMEVDESSFLEGIYYGKESPYTIFPLAREPELKDDSIFFVVYGEKTVISLPLIQIVKPLLVGPPTNWVFKTGQTHSENLSIFWAILFITSILKSNCNLLPKKIWSGNSNFSI